MKILIIGGGVLGQQLAQVYGDLAPTVWTKADLDITDDQTVWDKITSHRPDVVYNCAAVADFDYAEEHRHQAEAVNGSGAGNIARACQSVGAKLVYFSCAAVFKGDQPAGYSEDDSTGPMTVLGRSKVMGEMETHSNCDSSYIIRTSWLFGGGTFLEQWLKQAASGQPVRAADDEIGNPTYILDLAQASRALVEEEKDFGTYHIMNTGSVSKWDFANHALKLAGHNQTAVPVKKDAESLLAHRPQYQTLTNTQFLELRPWTEALEEFMLQTAH